jgi:addiction module RelE/StbE family toxin
MKKIRIKYDSIFKRNYRSSIKNNILKEEIKHSINLFLQNPYDPLLNNHEIRGKLKGRRSFSVLPDLRIIYIEKEDCYIFLDIGTHREVY